MPYRSPLITAQGLGSAKSGTAHWWLQRVTAAALIPLSYWLVKFLRLSLNAPYAETQNWLNQPVNAICIIAWLLAAFYHAALGLRVVIEDYIGGEARKIVLVWLTNLAFLLLTLAAIIAVFRIIAAG